MPLRAYNEVHPDYLPYITLFNNIISIYKYISPLYREYDY
jgi:hypothetical protein